MERYHRKNTVLWKSMVATGLLAITLPIIASATVSSQDPECFAVADNSQAPGSADALLSINFVTGQATYIGQTNTADIENMVFDLKGNNVYTVNGGQFGKFDLGTGKFVPIGSGLGTLINGEENKPILLDDIDGLAFDVTTGDLYASLRREHQVSDNPGLPRDILFKIDPLTGAFIPGVFPGGADYVVVKEPAGVDIDDLASDPADGTLYATTNSGDGMGSILVKLDKSTGVATFIGNQNVNDIEGLTFAPNGNLYGTSGRGSHQGSAADTTRNRLFLIDKHTGATSEVGKMQPSVVDGDISTGQQDIEAVACRAKPTEALKCVMYALHDEGQWDTQVFEVDPFANHGIGTVKPLGPLYKHLDIEGLALLQTPGGGWDLYGTAGGDNSGAKYEGILYRVNRETGVLQAVGRTGFSEVSALSSNLVDNTLWAWARGGNPKPTTTAEIDNRSGLIKIDPITGKGTMVKQFPFCSGGGCAVKEIGQKIGGIAWSTDGKKLYAVDKESTGSNLWVYNPTDGSMKIQCPKIVPVATEALEMQPNGILLVGTDGDKLLGMVAYDPEACKVVSTRAFTGLNYDDIESIAWGCLDRSWLYQGSGDANIELIKYQSIPEGVEDALRVALEEAGLKAYVESQHGELVVYVGEMVFKAKPMGGSTPKSRLRSSQEAGIADAQIESVTQPDGTTYTQLVIEDTNGQLEKWGLFPSAVDKASLEKALEPLGTVQIDDKGTVSLGLSSGQTLEGQLNLEILPATIPDGQSLPPVANTAPAKIETVGDINGDGKTDVVITYPTGEEQSLFLK